MFIKDCRKILKKMYQRTDQKLTIRTHTTLLKTTRQASRITILSTTIQETTKSKDDNSTDVQHFQLLELSP